MKKSFISIVLASALMICAVLPASAEDRQITYGKEKVQLVQVDNLEELEIGNPMFGVFTNEDGTLVVTTSDAADNYDVKLKQSPENAEAYAGKTYVVLDVLNNSDGDIYFCMMPEVEGSSHLFLRPDDTTKTILVDSDGVMQEAEWSEEASVSGRYAFIIPWEFEGYIFIPFSSFCEHMKWDESYLTEAKPLTHMGIHVTYATASYMELIINDLYVAAGLPEYQEPENKTPEPSPTPESSGSTATATSDQNSTSAAPTTSGSGSTAPSNPASNDAAKATQSQSASGGSENSSKTTAIIIGCAAAVVIIAIIVIIILKKKRKSS